MNQDELKEVLRLHKMWLNGAEGGERADLFEVYLRWADLSKADLRMANLRMADLSEADLEGADLEGADLKWAIGDGKRIKTIIGLKYHVNIWDDMMSIGCQQHKIDEWFEFSDDRIAKMDRGALEWWNANKQNIQFLVKMLSGE